ncbi:sarcosine oxidase gamma subunit [Gynuella sunshinyii YC6258]|uniref:Sarcosine oxidase gamma subunit n=1 Tax=Gynuella sunshinyii YC6258 TaxID=1445510 RepID=A0A0C5VU00_9GAMM|nr:sarcosine oxidase gamma subunit [Gynuella sunshinyii YC6258]
MHHVDKTLQNLSSTAVQLRENALLGHLVLRGDKSSGLGVALERVTGLSLPDVLLSTVKGEFVIRWVSPDEWLLTLPIEQAFTIECALRAEMTGHFAIVNVSGGQTILLLSGSQALNVLKKSTPYDVHECNFPIGKVVTSVFAKTQALLRRCDERQWELVVRRSFADYLWLWLSEAGREYGVTLS